jgi:MoxR-like ATPase
MGSKNKAAITFIKDKLRKPCCQSKVSREFDITRYLAYYESTAMNQFSGVADGVQKLIQNIKSLIYIETHKLEYIIASKIAGGHVILADSHGVGKTSLARALAGSFAWDNRSPGRDGGDGSGPWAGSAFSRVQCTVDLLPQDILGYTKLVGSSHETVFNPGPIFAHFVLCDEINLLTPKTQGSFFQAMEEQAVTVEGRTYPLPDPFFIIATMNLKGVHLFPLPAPQLDRFMIQISLGYPDFEDEAAIIRQHGRNDSWKTFGPAISHSELLAWRLAVDAAGIHDDVINYIATILRETRVHPAVQTGASPRTGVKLSRLARSLALVRGQDYATIDLVKEIFPVAVAHRLILKDASMQAASVCAEILASVPVDPKRRRVPVHGQ